MAGLNLRGDSSGSVEIQAPLVAGDNTLTLPTNDGTLLVDATSGGVSIADSISHTGDTNTAIRFPAADTFTVETAGSERIRIDSSGEFLVGKTTTGIADTGVRINSPGGINATGDSSSINLSTNNGGHLSLCNNDNTDGNFSNIGGYNSDGLVVSQINFVNTNHTSRTGDITFHTHNGTTMPERIRITSGGLVGIGTDNPSNRLHVESTSTQATFNSTNSNTYKIALQNAGVTTSWIGAAQSGDIFTIADNSVTSRFALTDNGTIHDTDGCAAEAVPPGTQVISAVTATNIQLSSSTGNLGNGITFNNVADRFDITEDGVYMIHAIVEVVSAANRPASTFSCGILKSGTSIAVNSYLHEGFTGGFTETFYCSTIEELSNGENISMTYTQNTGTNATITSNSRLLVMRIA